MSKNSKRRNRRLRRQEKRQRKLAKRQKKWVMENVYHNLVEKNMNYIINGLDTLDLNKTYVQFRLSSVPALPHMCNNV